MTDTAPTQITLSIDHLSLTAVVELLHSSHVELKRVVTDFHAGTIDATAAKGRAANLIETEAMLIADWCEVKERNAKEQIF
jgi:hypothetical protein